MVVRCISAAVAEAPAGSEAIVEVVPRHSGTSGAMGPAPTATLSHVRSARGRSPSTTCNRRESREKKPGRLAGLGTLRRPLTASASLRSKTRTDMAHMRRLRTPTGVNSATGLGLVAGRSIMQRGNVRTADRKAVG
jgi:hypothetical protein